MIAALKRQFEASPKIWLTTLAFLITAIVVIPALLLGKFKLLLIAVVALLSALLLIANPLNSLLLYIVLLPIEEVVVINALGTLTKLAAMIFVAAYLYHRRFRVDLKSFSRLAWMFLFWALASLIWSIQADWVGFNQLFQLFIMALLIADCVSERPELVRTIMSSYSISSFFVALIGISNFYRGLDASGISQSARTSAIEGQSVAHFAYYMLPAFLFSFQNIFDTARTRLVRALSGVATIVFLIAILMSGTRGAWLAIVVVIAVVYIPRMQIKQQIGLILVFVVMAAAVIQIPAVVKFVEYRTSTAIESGGAGRLDIWKISYQTFLSHPILGAGIRNTHEAMTFSNFESTPFDVRLNEPFRSRVTHNIYIQIAIELGVIGLIIFLLWMAELLFSPIFSKEWLFVLAYFIAMLVGGLTNPQLNRKYFWLVLALAEGLRYYSLKTRLKFETKEKGKIKITGEAIRE